MNRYSRCSLVGRWYNQGPRVVNGTVLQFQRNPANPHDPCAIRVTLVDQPDQCRALQWNVYLNTTVTMVYIITILEYDSYDDLPL